MFKHYGEAWFTTRPEVFGNIPLTQDYVLGEEIVQRFLALTQSKKHAVLWVEDLYDRVLIQTIQRIYDTRTLNALPRQYNEIQNVLRVTDDDNDDDGIITQVLQKKHQRSIRELQETGACLDHIRPDTSTIPYAGDGAFATRSLPNGTILTISPLHHIPNYYNFMNMYKIQRNNQRTTNSPHGGKVPPDDDDDDDDAPYYRILDEIQNQQVLMNYCYGHANSTVLLCPYGSGINYLNHHSTLYNVKLQWIPSTSTELIHTFQHNTSAVEHGTVGDLFRTERSQLAIMYVTIRDIQEGEELFIDYGSEWERAWNLHVQQFFDSNRTYDHPSSYISAFYFNRMFGQIPLPTILEQEQQQLPGLDMIPDDRRPCHLPDNLQVRCHRALLFQAIGNINYEYVWTDENHGVPCRIVDRFDPLFDPTHVSDSGNGTEQAKQFLYTVQLEWEDASGGEEQAESSSHISWILRTDVPRSAIQLFDVPFTSDIHQRRTFRHPIYLSNDLFPEQWRNLE